MEVVILGRKEDRLADILYILVPRAAYPSKPVGTELNSTRFPCCEHLIEEDGSVEFSTVEFIHGIYCCRRERSVKPGLEAESSIFNFKGE